MHSGKPKQCASKNCKVMVCENCRPKFKDGQRYCMLCAMSKEDEEEIDPKALARATKLTEARHEISVKFDSEKGEITGWEQFFAMFENESKTLN